MCLLTFAVDDVPSFKNLDLWRKEFVYYADVKADFPFLVVGNKVSENQLSSIQSCMCLKPKSFHMLTVQETTKMAVG